MFEIRESRPDDQAALEALYPAVFPEEDLLPLLKALLEEEAVISLVGIDDGLVAAHIALTACRIAGDPTGDPERVALLGPLAVAPARQRNGIGSALVEAGLQRLKQDGTKRVFVLGDPGYYRRFGFRPDGDVAPPYPLPVEWEGAWRSLGLDDDRPAIHGSLEVPAPWREPSLWGS